MFWFANGIAILVSAGIVVIGGMYLFRPGAACAVLVFRSLWRTGRPCGGSA